MTIQFGNGVHVAAGRDIDSIVEDLERQVAGRIITRQALDSAVLLCRWDELYIYESEEAYREAMEREGKAGDICD